MAGMTAQMIAAATQAPIPEALGGGMPQFVIIDAAGPADGYVESGRHDNSGYVLYSADGKADLVLSEHDVAPRLLATGHLVDDAATLIEAAWDNPDYAVFDGAPVGPLGLRRPAIRDAAGIVRFLIDRRDADAPLAHLFSDSPVRKAMP